MTTLGFPEIVAPLSLLMSLHDIFLDNLHLPQQLLQIKSRQQQWGNCSLKCHPRTLKCGFLMFLCNNRGSKKAASVFAYQIVWVVWFIIKDILSVLETQLPLHNSLNFPESKGKVDLFSLRWVWVEGFAGHLWSFCWFFFPRIWSHILLLIY